MHRSIINGTAKCPILDHAQHNIIVSCRYGLGNEVSQRSVTKIRGDNMKQLSRGIDGAE